MFFYHFVAIFDVCWLENNIFYVYGGSRPSCEHPIPRYGSQQGGSPAFAMVHVGLAVLSPQFLP